MTNDNDQQTGEIITNPTLRRLRSIQHERGISDWHVLVFATASLRASGDHLGIDMTEVFCRGLENEREFGPITFACPTCGMLTDMPDIITQQVCPICRDES